MGFFNRLFGHNELDESDEEQLRRVRGEPALQLLNAKLLDACDRLPGCSGRFGYDAMNPIPVNGVGGEVVYLNTLRAQSGAGVLYHRLGSKRTNVSPHPVDLYEVVAVDASQWATLHLSPYHPRRSREAPEGFERRPWSSVPKEMRAMIYVPAMGMTSTVEDFPLGLPAAVRGSVALRSISLSLGDSMARGVQRILEQAPGAWRRPSGGPENSESPSVDTTPCSTGAGEAWYVERIARYRLQRDDMQPLAVISGFAWKYMNFAPRQAVEYAMQTIYLSRHGSSQEKTDANTSWESAIRWSIDTGPNSFMWGLQCVETARSAC